MVNARTVDLPAGVNDVTLTGQAFDGTPRRIICSISKPNGGQQIGATVVDGSLSQNGFRVNLTASPPAAGYRLHFWASVATYWELEAAGHWETETGQPWETE